MGSWPSQNALSSFSSLAVTIIPIHFLARMCCDIAAVCMEVREKASALRGRAAQRCVPLAPQTPCGVWPRGAIHPHPGPLDLGTTGTLPEHPRGRALVHTAVENAGGLGQMQVNAFLPPGRPKSRSGGDGGRLVHACVGKDRKEGASFILH